MMNYISSIMSMAVALCVLACVFAISVPRWGDPVGKDQRVFLPHHVNDVLQRGLEEDSRMFHAAQVIGDGSGSQERVNDFTGSTHFARNYQLAFRKGDAMLESVIEYVLLSTQNRSVDGDDRVGMQVSQASNCTASPSKTQCASTFRDGEHLSALRQLFADAVPVQVIMASGDADVHEFHELTFVHAAMRYKIPLAVDGCHKVVLGFLDRSSTVPVTGLNELLKYRVPVLTVTVGHAHATTSAVCMAAVMSLSGIKVQSVMVIGTASVSPVVGGGGWHPEALRDNSANEKSVLATSSVDSSQSVEAAEVQTNPRCQDEWDANAVKVALGSVCVTHAAFLEECGWCVETNPTASLCSRLSCSLRNRTSTFGPCNFDHPTRKLADRIKAAMAGLAFPSMPRLIQDGMTQFWRANDAVQEFGPDGSQTTDTVARGSLSNRQAPETPILLHCAEASAGQKLVGPQNDILCRAYVKEMLGDAVDRENITCVRASDGVGILYALHKHHAHVPAVLIRAAADYTMLPLKKNRFRLVASPPLTREKLQQLLSQREDRAARATADGPEGSRIEPQQNLAPVDGKTAGEAGIPFADEQMVKMLRTNGRFLDSELSFTSTNATNERDAAAHGFFGTKEELNGSGKIGSQVPGDSTVSSKALPGTYVSWDQKRDFMSRDEYDDFKRSAVRYAIETASAVLLNYLMNEAAIPY